VEAPALVAHLSHMCSEVAVGTRVRILRHVCSVLSVN
jgi:hypothetical protein